MEKSLFARYPYRVANMAIVVILTPIVIIDFLASVIFDFKAHIWVLALVFTIKALSEMIMNWNVSEIE